MVPSAHARAHRSTHTWIIKHVLQTILIYTTHVLEVLTLIHLCIGLTRATSASALVLITYLRVFRAFPLLSPCSTSLKWTTCPVCRQCNTGQRLNDSPCNNKKKVLGVFCVGDLANCREQHKQDLFHSQHLPPTCKPLSNKRSCPMRYVVAVRVQNYNRD